MDRTKEMILSECPEWFHSIDLGSNLITPGRKSLKVLEGELRQLKLPDLNGKSVLDIGAYDGFFSFAAERLGASRVVALDHYIWSTDMAGYMTDWRKTNQTGEPLPSPHESRHWKPETLPGRKPFDLARSALDSKVEPVVDDFVTMSTTQLNRFDVVLFLGVLYHMENPLSVLKKVRDVTAANGLAVIETEAMEIPGSGRRHFCEFFPGKELNNDPSNWWSPNAAALEGLCRAAGFREVVVYEDRSKFSRSLLKSAVSFIQNGLKGKLSIPVRRYRAFVHARP